MPFRFSLAAVLRVRENLEHAESLILEKRYSELAKFQGMLWEAQQNIHHARQARQDQLTRGVTAIELQLKMEEEAYWKQRSVEVSQQLLQAQARLREQIAVYRKARQNRDVLEELRKQKFEIYRREQERAEQKDRDEAFLLRRKSQR
jgi:flagellar biosynthesis chaperone FliJ